MRIGFIGLGVMGQPMALNLARAGHRLVVWNRTAEACERVHAAGAQVVPQPADVFAASDAIVLMLFDAAAIDTVLQRGTPGFDMVRGRTVVNMSSVAPDYSRALASDVAAAAGRFVEAPVSGSRVPAEQGQLVAMLAGEEAVCDEVGPLLAPLCRQAIYCGPIGNGLLMKLAINIFMLCTSVGLAEAFHFADRHGLPLDRFRAVADSSQMASQLSRIKLAKLVAGDFTRQGSVADGVNNTKLITDAARDAGASAALITIVQGLFTEALALGHGSDDMIAVIRAIEARSPARTTTG
jgi:3-hydroxyisobutyrate dehydrogenase